MKQNRFKVVGAYDTETCNVGRGIDTRAYPILFIYNDFAEVPLAEYGPDDSRERVCFFRRGNEFLAELERVIATGADAGYIPIVCAYNLMFDLQPLMAELSASYRLKVAAQTSTNVYYLDLYDFGNPERILLRFWDTYFLEQNGLRAMGETAGVAKAVGDWDYTLVRTPETPLSDDELYYAKRDVQVIPAYLRYLLESNEWLEPEMLGVRVLTKTGLVRQMAANTFGSIRLRKRSSGKGYTTMMDDFTRLCTDELPEDYETYALRKACFRGGFTFTSGAYACKDISGVASLDVTSMHHTFINGRYIPVRFRRYSPRMLELFASNVLSTTRAQVLERYHQPFNVAFHIKARFGNIRLKPRTCFNEWGIALIPKGKFDTRVTGVDYWADDPRAVIAEQAVRDAGYRDRALNAEFAFGKLYKADMCELHVNEVELWALSRVYEWDSLEVLEGEATVKWKRPPDYVTLQSHLLYNRKNDCKRMTKTYDGTPYVGDIPASIPQGLADEMRDGTLDPRFLANYYNGTVKGMFNGVYGTMAQDVFKPEYMVEETGDIVVDSSTKTTCDNYEDKKPKKCKVLYTYGMRIVAGSRMHLIIALELLYESFDGAVYATGGDTDSIKCHVPDSVSDEDLERALHPILDASTKAIDSASRRIRADYPQYASTLTHVGGFEVENAGAHYTHHMEYWNKARCSYRDGEYHVTMAGLSRPLGAYHIEHVLADMERAGYSTEQVLTMCLGYNVNVASSVSFSLMPRRPNPWDIFDGMVTDYMGHTSHVVAYESVALYQADRMLGDTVSVGNRENVDYIRRHGGDVCTELRELHVDTTKTAALTSGFSMENVLMKGVPHGTIL